MSSVASDLNCIIDEDKYYLLILCVKLLDNLYFELSYNGFKSKFRKNLQSYLNLPANYSKEFENQSIYDIKSILIDKLKSSASFKEDIYAIPLFLLTFSIKNGTYDSRNSFLIKNLSQCLKLNPISLEKYEEQMMALITKTRQSNEHTFKTDKYKKYCKIAGASIIGGTLLGLTGGLIAPFLAASSGIILGSTGAAMLGTTAGLSIIGSLFGLTGATLTGYKMNRRSGLLSEFNFQSLNSKGANVKSLSLTIAVSGWINKDCDFATPWRDLRITPEAYTLCWESQYLLKFGHGINYLVQWATGTLVQEVLQETVLSTLLSSIAWPLTLISLASVIDNPWGVCFNRSQEVGKELANVLISRVPGRRPVTLIGFSLGARVIYHALNYLTRLLPKKTLDGPAGGSASFKGKPRYQDGQAPSSPSRVGNLDRNRPTSKSVGSRSSTPSRSETDAPGIPESELTEDGNQDPRGIIEDVILIGAPIPAKDDETYTAWLDVVAGQITNCYCSTDWILKFLYRTSSAQISVAGLQPIELMTGPGKTNHPRILNVDASSIVTGHNDYVGRMGDLLKTLGYHSDFYRSGASNSNSKVGSSTENAGGFSL